MGVPGEPGPGIPPGQSRQTPYPIVGKSWGLEWQVQDPFLQQAFPGALSLVLWLLSCYPS